MIRDDRGASILLEYIMSIVITAVLFSVMLVILNSVILNTDKVVTEPQLAIIANDIANQVSSFSNEVNFNRYNDSSWNSGMSRYNSTLLLPELAQDKEYVINIHYDNANRAGYVRVSLESNPGINRTSSFHSAVKVADTMFYNNLDKGTIAYDATSNTIEVTVP